MLDIVAGLFFLSSLFLSLQLFTLKAKFLAVAMHLSLGLAAFIYC